MLFRRSLALTTFYFLLALPCARAEGPGGHQGNPAAGAAQGGSAPQPQARECTLESITGGCAIFDPEQGDLLELADGTLIPNFAAIGKVRDQKKLSDSFDKAEKQGADSAKESLDLQFDLLHALGSIPDGKMSPKLKFYLAQRPQRIKYVIGDEVSRTVQILWPPQDPKQVQTLTSDEVKREILPLLDPETLRQLRDIAARADASQRKSVIFAFHGDGPALERMRTVSPARKQRVEELVAYAREQLVRLATAARPETEWTEAQKAAVAKLRDIRVTPFDDKTLKTNAMCLSTVPNAFYSPSDHSINICPAFYNFPDSTIVSVIAHELGHAIDPCLSQFGVYEVDAEKLAALRDGDRQARAEVKNDNDRFRLFRLFDAMEGDRAKRGDSRPMLTAYPLSFGDPAAIGYFEQAGVLKERSKGYKLDDYIFKEAYACLKSDAGGGFRAHDAAEIRRVAEEVTRQRAEVRGASYDREADRRKVIAAFEAHPECVGIDKHSQMGEVLADWAGSKVLGNFLQSEKAAGRPIRTPLERLAPVSFFSSLVCMERLKAEAKEKSGSTSLDDTVVGALMDYTRTMDPHPGSRKRIDDIYLRDPNVRSALGCDAAAGAC